MRRYLIIAFSLTVIICTAVFSVGSVISPSLITSIQNKIAAVFFVDKVTVSTLQDKYALASSTGRKVKILIVPGHEPDNGGSEYRTLIERDMNVDMAKRLAAILEADPHFDVTLARDSKSWNPVLLKYFSDNFFAIENWVEANRANMQNLIDNKVVQEVSKNPHSSAPFDMATRLYGINKWAGENNFDITIHIHFNDYGYRRVGRQGQYYGLSIYVPERQYSNATASRKIAESILKELTDKYAISDAPKEQSGIVEDQELIALGSNNTADTVSLLIEYGYIYEAKFWPDRGQDKTFADMAARTYNGLDHFFNNKVVSM